MSAINNVILTGRLVADPQFRTAQGDSNAVARYTLAVDRRRGRDGEQKADFIPCVAFGKSAEFTNQYYKKGTKISIQGHIQSGSYEKDGQKVYTLNVIVEDSSFAEPKKTESGNAEPAGFVDIPDGEDEILPFK